MDRPRDLRFACWCALLLGSVLVCGCATTEFVQLRHKPRNPLTERLNTSAFGIVRHSERTEVFLSQSGYRGSDDLKPMIEHAARFHRDEHPHEALHASAELCYLAAGLVKSRDAALASELYLDSAHAAWTYFTTPDAQGVFPEPNDAGHRVTAEVYNTSTEQLLRICQATRSLKLGQSVGMPLTRRTLQFEIPVASQVLTPEQLGDFEFVSDYELKNLRNRHTTSGLGVPVIAMRNQTQKPEPVERYYTKGMSFPATVVLKFPNGTPTARADRTIRLQVYDPNSSDGLMAGHRMLPLETDVSTPLARYLTNRDLSLLDTWAFLRPDRASSLEGLYMVQPYDPERIPVLMVHGVWSSPMTWMEMFNELQADPEIRRRYQFWFYLYPTGEPIAFSAAALREELIQVRNDCDPYRRNDRLDEMVVVGHSMGGLISQMLTLDSGDRLWNSVSSKPVDQINVSPDQKSEIQRVFFFQSNPSIDRIVTIACPYGGSSLSNRFTRWLSGSFVWLPAQTYELTKVIFDQNELSWWQRMTAPKTSLDSLTKKSAVLQLISDSVVPAGVHHHNIVGVRRGSNIDTWTDGVVNFRSAHRDRVDSEKVVKAGHSEILRSPETVAEVRRVLLEHLHEVRARRFPVVPVQHSDPAATSRSLAP